MKKYVFLPFVLLIAYTILDLLNIPTLIGIRIDNINTGLLEIVVNSLVVIILYILTFKSIDSRNMSRMENQTKSAELILRRTYIDCQKSALYIQDDKIFSTILKKVNFDKAEGKDSIIYKYYSTPFENENLLYQFFADGALSSKQFEEYLKIKTDFTSFISSYIMFYDHPEIAEQQRMPLFDELKAAIHKLDD